MFSGICCVKGTCDKDVFATQFGRLDHISREEFGTKCKIELR